jgi:hypothetical protein
MSCCRGDAILREEVVVYEEEGEEGGELDSSILGQSAGLLRRFAGRAHNAED